MTEQKPVWRSVRARAHEINSKILLDAEGGFGSSNVGGIPKITLLAPCAESQDGGSKEEVNASLPKFCGWQPLYRSTCALNITPTKTSSLDVDTSYDQILHYDGGKDPVTLDEILCDLEKICNEFNEEKTWSLGEQTKHDFNLTPRLECANNCDPLPFLPVSNTSKNDSLASDVCSFDDARKSPIEAFVPKFIKHSNSFNDSNNLEGNSEENEVDNVRDILAALNFSKFKRGPTFICTSGVEMEKPPKSPKSKSPNTSPPTSSNPEVSSSSKIQYKKPNTVFRSSSFSQVENTFSNSPDYKSKDKSNTESIPASVSLTLPRKRTPNKNSKISDQSHSLASSLCVNQVFETEQELCKSDLSVDSAVESVTDEGFDTETDPIPNLTYASCSIIPEPTTANLNITIKSPMGVEQAFTVTSADPPSLLTSSDKRKRRKGISAPSAGTRPPSHEVTKSGTCRSLTFPPQRKTSLTEEELKYTSLDSNGIKSLSFTPNLQIPTVQEYLRLPSDLSLADSHYSPSEILGEETYRDVVESVTTDLQKLHVEDRNSKALKKKHHSDPGSDKNTGENIDFPEIMNSSFRSEPGLGKQESSIIRESVSETQLTSPTSAPSPHLSTSQPKAISMSQMQMLASETEEKTKSPQQQRRYYKKRLRGPYGEMLEEEMRKSGEKAKLSYCEDLSFLHELGKTKVPTEELNKSEGAARPNLYPTSQSLDDSQLKSSSTEVVDCVPRRKISANFPLGNSEQMIITPNFFGESESWLSKANEIPDCQTNLCGTDGDEGSTSTNSGLLEDNRNTNASDDSKNSPTKKRDTRTHIVSELYETERSYVESLSILVHRYMRSLRSPENSTLVDQGIVDEIFFKIPEILKRHEMFLDALKDRLNFWNDKQKIGDVFIDVFLSGEASTPTSGDFDESRTPFIRTPIIELYTAFINNWKTACDGIKVAIHARPAFGRFLETMAREHKGKLSLDALLIMPVQRIPRYELLLKELVKHTQVDHPDHQLLIIALKEVHGLAVKINELEKEAFQYEQMQQGVRQVEQMVEGVFDLVQPGRTYICHDLVIIPGNIGNKKERCIFLLSDLLLVTSIKRKSGTIRKPAQPPQHGSPAFMNSVDMYKYKILMNISLDLFEINKRVCLDSEGNLRKNLKEIELLEEDLITYNEIKEKLQNINSEHLILDKALHHDMETARNRLEEKQNIENQHLGLEMSLTTQDGIETITILFATPEKRLTWETTFNAAKSKLALVSDRSICPQFLFPLPIRKTRAGLQFTCASPTMALPTGLKDVWVCNSDGYVGQICVLSLHPEPTVTSCNGVCSSRITCVASIPPSNPSRKKTSSQHKVPGSKTEEKLVEEQNEPEKIQTTNGSTDEETEQKNDSLEECQFSSNKEDIDNDQPTMWLGTEDGCIHIFNCNDNIRITKNKFKFQLSATVHSIMYHDGRVFVAIDNGDLCVFVKDPIGAWDTSGPLKVTFGSPSLPITKLLPVVGNIWCACINRIKIVNASSLTLEHSLAVAVEDNRSVVCMVTSGMGVWVAVQGSSYIRLYHATTYEVLLDLNVAPAVTKMLASCDDIIRQHKTACLRVTSALTCQNLLWVGTSAGVLLTISLPHVTAKTTRLEVIPNILGVNHGHTGHVRFLASVELPELPRCNRSVRPKESAPTYSKRDSETGTKTLVLSGGDGYEDFTEGGGADSAAGRDDSTNHLLLWQV